MVVACGEGAQVTETVEGDSVFWCAEADSSVVPGDLSLSDIVRSLSTKKETITANNGICGEGWALCGFEDGNTSTEV